MSDYQTGIEGMPKLLDCCGGRVMEYFQKKNYADSFQKMYQEHISTFDAIEKVYIADADREKVLADMAEALTGYAQEQINAISRKSKREQLQMDLNLTMAVFVLPMVLEFHGESSQPLAQKLVDSWKERFPKTNIQAAEYSTIESGFHKTWCYITTAVCRTFGKPDDCYELTVLREYRDTFLADSPGGAELIREYYDKAPSIVKHIDQQPDAREIYRSIWEEWLAPCISMVENDRKEECRDHYVAMVQSLQKKYFHQQ